MNSNLDLPICPKCGDTRHVKVYEGYQKMAQPFACMKCRIVWAADYGAYDMPSGHDKYCYDISKD